MRDVEKASADSRAKAKVSRDTKPSGPAKMAFTHAGKTLAALDDKTISRIVGSTLRPGEPCEQSPHLSCAPLPTARRFNISGVQFPCEP